MLTTGSSGAASDPFAEAVADAMNDFVVAAGGQVSAVPAKKVLVAFSGGADSTALLFGLAAMKTRLGLELYACHVNHGLREEAKLEAEFCRKTCHDLGIPLRIEELPPLGSSSEASLRDARYERLAVCAADWHCSICVTGHTADDQAETILFRLFRGTAPGGAVSIPSWRSFQPELLLMRPLLELKHEDCKQYLNRLHVDFCLDSSNMEWSYSRNYIRHKVVPVIEERFPGFAERLIQFASLLEADERYISANVDLVICSAKKKDPGLESRNDLQDLPLALRRRLLVRSLLERQIEPSARRIESLLEMLEADQDCALSLSKRWDLRMNQGVLSWIDKELADQEKTVRPADFEFELSTKGLTLIAPLNMMIGFNAVSLNPGSYPGAQELEILADLSSISPPLVLRYRRPGDRIQPLGMQSLVRLKKFLHTHKSTATLTLAGRTIVLADQAEVLWVPGCGISEKIAVRKRPTHRVSFKKLVADPVSIG